MSLPDDPAGQVPSVSWTEPAPVEDSTMGPKKVVVASKVCGAVQVTDEAAVMKPEFAKVYVMVFGFEEVETESPPEPRNVKVDEVMPLSVIEPPPPDPQSLTVPETTPLAFT